MAEEQKSPDVKDQLADLTEEQLASVHEFGGRLAKIVDDTITEIEKEDCQETDAVYICTDNQPPEVRRVKGEQLGDELWNRVIEARRADGAEDNAVTIITVANGQCTVSLCCPDEKE